VHTLAVQLVKVIAWNFVTTDTNKNLDETLDPLSEFGSLSGSQAWGVGFK
jgi:hypothetical protein